MVWITGFGDIRSLYHVPNDVNLQKSVLMFRWFRKAYENYKDYIRVDLAMYVLLLLMILLYLVYRALIG